ARRVSRLSGTERRTAFHLCNDGTFRGAYLGVFPNWFWPRHVVISSGRLRVDFSENCCDGREHGRFFIRRDLRHRSVAVFMHDRLWRRIVNNHDSRTFVRGAFLDFFFVDDVLRRRARVRLRQLSLFQRRLTAALGVVAQRPHAFRDQHRPSSLRNWESLAHGIEGRTGLWVLESLGWPE